MHGACRAPGLPARGSLSPCSFQTEVQGLLGLGHEPGRAVPSVPRGSLPALFGGGAPSSRLRDKETEPAPLLTTSSVCRFPAIPSHR